MTVKGATMKFVNRGLYPSSASPSSSPKKFKKIISVLVLAAGVGGLVFALGKMNLLGKPPVVELARNDGNFVPISPDEKPLAVGKNVGLSFLPKSSSGICRVFGSLAKGDKSVGVVYS